MHVCADIARYKDQMHLPVYDPKREGQKMEDVLRKADADLHEYTGELYTLIFKLSRSYQERIKK